MSEDRALVSEDTAFVSEDTALVSEDTLSCAKSRSEELEELAKARTVFLEKSVGVVSFIYGFTQTSFLQLCGSVLPFRGGLAKFELLSKF